MKALRTIKPGGKFAYGGVNWQVLEQEAGRALCLAAESIGNKAFDKENHNDWRESSLREYLNGEFLESLTENGASEDAIHQTKFDLVSEDGLNDYGISIDRVGLLSCNQYRKFRKLISPVNGWWWTITPYSTIASYACDVRIVISDGTLYNGNAYYGSSGVRPLCNFDSSILVSFDGEDGEDQEEKGTIRGITIEIGADTSGLDDAIEKAERLKSLLQEANDLIGSLKSAT
ncbi:DUF6273 domain-containing protein [Caproicibacter fermentans]|uniref:Mucin-5AC n=1 Tax=Caproicibacter fermentans TaxID=2576756 RepID=A0A7G8TE12_9FIRM|nr:DUF6273 domain-containing protein [Caproicibacter fermentans]QNK41853.1 mucin-5AC [Caproicibacter fermentans]